MNKVIVIPSFFVLLVFYWVMYWMLLHADSPPYSIKNISQIILVAVIACINYIFIERFHISVKTGILLLIVIYTLAHFIGSLGHYTKTGETIFRDPMSLLFSFLFYIYGFIALIVSFYLYMIIWRYIIRRLM